MGYTNLFQIFDLEKGQNASKKIKQEDAVFICGYWLVWKKNDFTHVCVGLSKYIWGFSLWAQLLNSKYLISKGFSWRRVFFWEAGSCLQMYKAVLFGMPHFYQNKVWFGIQPLNLKFIARFSIFCLFRMWYMKMFCKNWDIFRKFLILHGNFRA